MKLHILLELLLTSVIIVFAGVPAARAADYKLAGALVHFAAPDAWTPIMQKTEGDPQFVALQVPGAGADTLARVTVSAQQVGDAQGYRQFVAAAAVKSRKLAGYQPGAGVPGTEVRYSATENKQRTDYREFYAFRNGFALQVRCVRPAAASGSWNETFDAGCSAIAKSIAQP